MIFSDNSSDSAIRRVTLNGKAGGHKVGRPWIEALNDPHILTEKAGFLFKAAVRGDHLFLAVVPVLIDGKRSYHYEQHLDNEDAFTLAGDVNASGVFTILFKPEKMPLSAEHARRYRHSINLFTEWLLAEGYSGKGLLSEVTQCVLRELEYSPVPQTLKDLQRSV